MPNAPRNSAVPAIVQTAQNSAPRPSTCKAEAKVCINYLEYRRNSPFLCTRDASPPGEGCGD